jgi:uncharacterized membrane protein YeiH
MISLLTLALDWLGIVAFAVTGALVASRKEMDITGFALLGTATGIGGGTARDLLLGKMPVFWVAEPAYLLVCIGVSALVFFTAHIPASRMKWLLWLDALGLSLFCVIGAEKALVHGPVVAVAMGVVTATFGGVLRDILGGESPVILRREIYATAALLGAIIFVALILLGLPRDFALAAGFLGALALRGLALTKGWHIPVYRSRPGGQSELR